MNKKINKLVHETERNYQLRVNFIKLNNPKTKKELEICIMFSKIFVNIITLGCRYSIKIEKELNKSSNKVKKILNSLNNSYFKNF